MKSKILLAILILCLTFSIATALEYDAEETLYLKVYDAQNSSQCYFDVWYPNSTKWLNNISTTFLSNNIYYNDTYETVEEYGVYITEATCNTSHVETGEFKITEDLSYQFLIPIALAIFSIVFGGLAIYTSRQNIFLQMLFLVISEGLALASVGIIGQFYTNTVITSLIIVLLGVLAITFVIMFIMFVIYVFEIWNKAREYVEKYKG